MQLRISFKQLFVLVITGISLSSHGVTCWSALRTHPSMHRPCLFMYNFIRGNLQSAKSLLFKLFNFACNWWILGLQVTLCRDVMCSCCFPYTSHGGNVQDYAEYIGDAVLDRLPRVAIPIRLFLVYSRRVPGTSFFTRGTTSFANPFSWQFEYSVVKGFLYLSIPWVARWKHEGYLASLRRNYKG